MTDADLVALARVQLLDDILQAKAAWYRLRVAQRILGPLERHHDCWLRLVEREDIWPPSGAGENAGTLSPMRQSG